MGLPLYQIIILKPYVLLWEYLNTALGYFPFYRKKNRFFFSSYISYVWVVVIGSRAIVVRELHLFTIRNTLMGYPIKMTYGLIFILQKFDNILAVKRKKKIEEILCTHTHTLRYLIYLSTQTHTHEYSRIVICNAYKQYSKICWNISTLLCTSWMSTHTHIHTHILILIFAYLMHMLSV